MLERFRQHEQVLLTGSGSLDNQDIAMQQLPRVKPTPVGLLDIPFEIRLQIYHYCITRKRIVNVHLPGLDHEDDTLESESCNLNLEDDTPKETHAEEDVWPDFWNIMENKNSLFRVSKQISEEALNVLYGENIFQLRLDGAGEYCLRKNFSKENRQRMRCLLVVAQPMGVSFNDAVPDDALWSSILPHLKAFRLVAQQPLESAGYDNAPTLEQEVDGWVKWIRPFLECFGRHLPSGGTVVDVDDDDRKETSELVKECLPNGCRKVRCRLVGDLLFKRWRFSIESG